jgi:hypothetical protein
MSYERPAPWDPSGPPALAVDAEAVTVWFEGVVKYQIRWDQIEQVSLSVVVAPEADYSEAFWSLTGDGVHFGAPVEVIMNAEDLNQRLFALPGFDMGAYRRAREAESNGQPGDFICWRRASA